MSLEIRPLNEQTVEDFKSVVRCRFSNGAIELVDKVISNPVREKGSDSGAIGYENEKPVCIRASIMRKVYFGQEPFLGTVGGLLAKKQGSDRSLLKRVVKNSIASRNGSKIFFTNTSVRSCVRLNIEAGVSGHGPEYWTSKNVVVYRPIVSWWLRFASIHPSLPKIRFKPYKFCPDEAFERRFNDGKCIRRESELNSAEIDDFWARYLRHNVGLVSSRSFAEINWAYGARLKTNVIFLSLRDRSNMIIGYVAASCPGRNGLFWRIVDWIALDNDVQSLDLMMGTMVDYVRKRTPAVELSIAGFSNSVQGILSKYATRRDISDHNPYLFHCYDQELLAKIASADEAGQSWFWGPYDGDMCME